MRMLRGATVSVIAASAALAISWAALMGGVTLGVRSRQKPDREPLPRKEAESKRADAALGVKQAQIAKGRELFLRNWLANDPRSRGGDGLGPLYNATSCVDCHSQGRPGGAGPIDRNVDVVTLKTRLTIPSSDPDSPDPLDEFHPGFRTAASVILHRYSTEPDYRAWRLRRVDGVEHADMAETGGDAERDMVRETVLKGDPSPRSTGRKLLEPARPGRRSRVVGIKLLGEVASVTQRNTPALFGSGLIDAIPVESLEKAALDSDPRTRGRMNWLADGQVGRFGWKAQTATLRDFVMSACAIEIGLEVPGHHQSRSPLDFEERKPAKLDLNDDDCNALTAFVAALPPPAESPLPEPEARVVSEGRERFTAIGCAGCHRPNVGTVVGIYSDLLLHDMGVDLRDSGSVYYGSEQSGGTKSEEWRTPPLWGYRDSGPYLHDGRARTLEQAVALHGGQAERSSKAYFGLRPEQRAQVEAFLNSLVAPATP